MLNFQFKLNQYRNLMKNQSMPNLGYEITDKI